MVVVEFGVVAPLDETGVLEQLVTSLCKSAFNIVVACVHALEPRRSKQWIQDDFSWSHTVIRIVYRPGVNVVPEMDLSLSLTTLSPYIRLCLLVRCVCVTALSRSVSSYGVAKCPMFLCSPELIPSDYPAICSTGGSSLPRPSLQRLS